MNATVVERCIDCGSRACAGGESCAAAQAETAPERARILAALERWIKQRPGLDPRNYISGGGSAERWREEVANYRREVREIGRDLRDARELLRAVELRPSIDAAALREAFRAYSGRLSWHAKGEACAVCRGVGTLEVSRDGEQTRTCYRCKGSGVNRADFLDYCTGQYWPTEYRRAVCAVLRTALWDRWRADAEEGQKAAPKCDAFPELAEHPWNCGHCHGSGHEGPSVRDRILRTARAELSRGVYRRWFVDA